MPEVYTHGHHESVLRSHKWRTAENSAAYLLPHLAEDARVLDVGCGPGTITAGLADRVPRGHVTGIDAAQEIIEQARAAAGDRANLDFATGDVYALDYPDDSFDVVHAHQVLQHLSDPVRALREMRRVTRPGGIVAVRDGDYGGMTWYPELPVLDEWRAFYMRGRPRQRRRAERRAPPARLGQAGGLHRRHLLVVQLDLRHRGRPVLVGRPVGRPHGQVVVRGRRARGRPRHRRGPGADRRRLARLGRGPGRLVPRPERRDPLPGALAS